MTLKMSIILGVVPVITCNIFFHLKICFQSIDDNLFPTHSQFFSYHYDMLTMQSKLLYNDKVEFQNIVILKVIIIL
jgi:hypothetical protein